MSYGNGQTFESICKDDSSNCERKAHEFFKRLNSEDPQDYTFQINDQTTTPLHICCKYHNTSVLRIIFQYGCRSNAVPAATTALHDALEYDGPMKHRNPKAIRQALRKHSEFFKVAMPLFAANGFDFQQKNHEGRTVAHICAKNGLAHALKQIPPQELQKMLHVEDSKSFTAFALAKYYHDNDNYSSEQKHYGSVMKLLENMTNARKLQISFRDNQESPWGVTINYPDSPYHWRVAKVDPNGHFYDQGVRKNWKVMRVNDLDVTTHTEETANALTEGLACTITFLGIDSIANKNDFSAFVGSQSSSRSKRQVSHSNRSKSGTSSLQRTSSQSSRPRSGRISAASTSHSRQKHFSYQVGDRVEVTYDPYDGEQYGGYISRLEDNQVLVKYDDYGEEILTAAQIEGCKPGRFYSSMLVTFKEEIHIIQKALPNNLYEVNYHDEDSLRLKGNQMSQVLVGDTVYAPYTDVDDPNSYEATITNMHVKEGYIDVKYKDYPNYDATRLSSEYYSKIYTIMEWKNIQQKKDVAEKAEEERRRLESEKKRRQKSEENRRRREHSKFRRESQRRRESVERQMSRGSSSCTTQSSARESVFGASVDRSVPRRSVDVHRSQSAASSHHYNKPPPPTKEEEEEDIPDDTFWTVLHLLPEIQKDKAAFVTILKENGIKSWGYFWRIVSKCRDWVEAMHNHFTNKHSEDKKEWKDCFEKQQQEIENLESRNEELQRLIDTSPEQLLPFLKQTHDQMERYKKENEQMKQKLEEYRRNNADLKQKLEECRKKKTCG